MNTATEPQILGLRSWKHYGHGQLSAGFEGTIVLAKGFESAGY